jgi:threonine/homoserine/homoserine lactone efflux protein
MSDVPLLLQGLLLGVAIAAPVGPIGLLCIQRTLNDGRLTGFVSGLGAATADACYGFVAAFGLTAISSFLLGQQFWLGIVGGLYLCYLGVRMMLSQPATVAAQAEGASLARAYASTLMLTLTNPMTILFFVAIYAGAGLAAGVRDYAGAAWLVVGVFLGSACWWLLLSGITALLRTRIAGSWLRWVNVVAGSVIVGFGLFALWSVRT